MRMIDSIEERSSQLYEKKARKEFRLERDFDSVDLNFNIDFNISGCRG